MTLKELLATMVNRQPDRIALRYKEAGHWHTIRYQELEQRAAEVGQLLADRGVKPGQHVALYRANAPEWPEIYFGIVGIGATAVPVDAKLREQEIAHILRDSSASVIFAESRNYHVIRELEPHLPDLKHVILINGNRLLPVDGTRLKFADYAEARAAAAEQAASKQAAYRNQHPGPDDVASLIYTSGTTGRPKGAMLSHHNFCTNVQACLEVIGVSETDNFMLVLPLHHAFAFTANMLVPIGAGAEISFVESIRTIAENMAEAEPTVLIGVPLLLEKMYAKIQAGLRKNRVAYLMTRVGLSHVVGKKLIKKLGGKLRIVVSGAAPIDPDVLRGWEKLGVTVREGYGLTETAPVATLNPPSKNKIGTIGCALPGVEIKIIDPNPEGVGEIAVKGDNVMLGYYRQPEATAEIMQDDWLLTGDLGFIDEDGFVTICGRKKSLIVNREGKNIYPEEVEHQICKSPYIAEALALGYRPPGERAGERVGLIVVPDQEAVDEYAAHHKKNMSDRDVEQLVQKEVKSMCKNLADYKRPRYVQVQFEEFEKTSTQKVKRYLYAIDTSRIPGGGKATLSGS
jgi:long-chain acyl-CoA synthetase